MAGFPHNQPLSKRSPFARMGTGITLCLALLATVLSAAASGQALTCDGKAATIVGTEGNDRIYGTDGDDVIVALGGIDIIRSFDGKDTICGGEGRDRIYAGRGADVIFGEGKNDGILGQAGADINSGGPGRDTLLGGGGNDNISAGGGNDKRIEGGPGADTLTGGSGSDRCAVDADDEGKRCAETLFFDYHRENGVDIRVVRIFNTYGPRMLADDGRVVSNFIVQALKGEDLTVYGDGSQTRSFCYVDDLIEGFLRLMNQEETVGPVNIGNPDEITIMEFAKEVLAMVNNPKAHIIHKDLPKDDPKIRKPDITKAKEILGWTPKYKRHEGMLKTYEYFKKVVEVPAEA